MLGRLDVGGQPGPIADVSADRPDSHAGASFQPPSRYTPLTWRTCAQGQAGRETGGAGHCRIHCAPDTVMDLSSGENIHATREWILRNSPGPIGTIPVYRERQRALREGLNGGIFRL